MEITAQAGDVARIIGNALLHAGKDSTLPVLTAVRLECEAGTLTAVATDRYTLGMDTATVEGDATFALLLDRDDAAKIVKACKEAAKSARLVASTITLAVATDALGCAVTLTVTLPGQTITASSIAGEFPRYRSLIPDAATLAAADGANRVAFNPANLTKFAKVDGGERHANARFYITASNKPTVIRVGQTFIGILMPVRLTWTCESANPEKNWQHCSHNEGHTGEHSWHVAAELAQAV